MVYDIMHTEIVNMEYLAQYYMKANSGIMKETLCMISLPFQQTKMSMIKILLKKFHYLKVMNKMSMVRADRSHIHLTK